MTAEQLRKSILKYAIEGKLVAQDSNDESASVLLKKIQDEKCKLIANGKIKKPTKESCIYLKDDGIYYEKIGKIEKNISSEVPFVLPNGWEWTRCANIFSIVTGKKDANWGTEDGLYDFYTCSNKPIKSPTYSFEGESLLLPGNGANVGLCFYVNDKIEVYQRTYVLQPFIKDILDLQYIKLIFDYSWRTYNNEKMYGSAIPYIKLGNIQDYILPIPPLEEQKRIVKKIEQLEPLINEYDQLEKKATKLDGEIKDKFKKSILQYAIEGKLVSQNPNEESASVLLEHMKEKNKKLIGKKFIDSYIYKDNDGNYVEHIKDNEINITGEIPFDIPDSWEWIRLGTLFEHNTGKALNSSNKEGQYMTYITTSNLYWNRFDFSVLKEMRFKESEIEKCTVRKNDLLVCEGGDVGRAAIWRYNYPIRIQNHIHKLRSKIDINVKFYYFVLYAYKNAGLIGGKGIGIQGLSSKVLDQIIIPLPPLEEQKRIVNKLEQIFELLK